MAPRTVVLDSSCRLEGISSGVRPSSGTRRFRAPGIQLFPKSDRPRDTVRVARACRFFRFQVRALGPAREMGSVRAVCQRQPYAGRWSFRLQSEIGDVPPVELEAGWDRGQKPPLPRWEPNTCTASDPGNLGVRQAMQPCTVRAPTRNPDRIVATCISTLA